MNEETKSLAVSTEASLARDFKLELEPRSITALADLAASMAAIALCGVRTPEEAMARMLTGRELGLTTMQSMRGVYIIENRPALDATLMHGLCLQSPLCEQFESVETTEERATFKIKRKGWSEAKLHTFTIEEAQKAGLLDRGKDEEAKKNNNWNKWRKRMLEARAKSTAARLFFPEVTFGLYTPDEVSEGSSDPMPGAVVSAEVIVSRPKRDLEQEFIALAEKITGSKSREELSAARKEANAWAADVGEPWAGRVAKTYDEFVAAKRKAAKAAEPPPPAEVDEEPPGAA